ncbi:hydroxyacid dehydrogenase [Clostridium sp. MCC353]|uniref:hydroxyacid dehydrogenase n=1 Tax=Clostridium sp. MCC353 TaxID=2592646 RepID=UPI001C036A00|nr:hydroxyacid dehydrogenase [Clostridium sp. MCC353]MBT9780042.1 hydroxyacid dehydrogenase [Clostridium sp. MCC353]
MKILVTVGAGEVKDSFFTPKAKAALEALGDVEYNDTGRQAYTKEELIEHIKDVDILVTGWKTPRIDEDVLKAANRLKIHAHTGGTVATMICKEEYDRGIIVLSGNDLFAKSVAEGCLAYTLMSLRCLYDEVNSIKNDGWRRVPGNNSGMIGKKIGIVGYGAIAKYYIDLLKWFQPEILVASKYITGEEAEQKGVRIASAEEIFETCDIISLHGALNKETRGMITEDLLKRIKPGALFVNTARAGIVDEEAMMKELKTGRFKAILDVYHQEPLPADSELRNLDNVLLFPHMAGPTFDMREKVTLKLAEDILAILEGRPYEDGIPYEYAVRMTSGG